jgi:hypothetical protein
MSRESLLNEGADARGEAATHDTEHDTEVTKLYTRHDPRKEKARASAILPL